MKTSELQTATFTDIVFDGRNKEYGAYELRTLYWKRLLIALLITTILVIIGFFFFRIFGKEEIARRVIPKHEFLVKEYTTGQKKRTEQKKVEKKDTPKEQKLKVVQNTEPIITKDATKPPERTEDKENAKNTGQTHQDGDDEEKNKKDGNNADSDGDGIADTDDICKNTYGVENSPLGKGCPMPLDRDEDGIADTDDICPTVNAQTGKYTGTIGKGCPEKPKEEVITKPDEVATFRGDWASFLSNNIEYPDTEDEGVVIVKYIVDLNGNISDVKAVSGSVELRKEAERAVRSSSGRWAPAKLGGKPVKAYGSQKVVFKRE